MNRGLFFQLLEKVIEVCLLHSNTTVKPLDFNSIQNLYVSVKFIVFLLYYSTFVMKTQTKICLKNNPRLENLLKCLEFKQNSEKYNKKLVCTYILSIKVKLVFPTF